MNNRGHQEAANKHERQDNIYSHCTHPYIWERLPHNYGLQINYQTLIG